jgi:hypothetical protein
VRSRCQAIRLDALPAEAVARVLAAHGLPGARTRELAALAEGSPGRALELEGEDATRACARLLGALPGLREVPAVELSQIAQELSRGGTDAALVAAVGWYRDVLATALAGDALPLRNPEAAGAVRSAAARLPPVARLRQLEVVCDTMVGLEKNANRMLSLETMLLWLRDIERAASPPST